MDLPDNIYNSVVRSLYADAKTLLVGILSMSIAPMVLYWKNGESAHLVFSALLLIFGIARLHLVHEFNSKVNSNTTRKEYRAWENRYIALSSLYIALIGVWVVQCFWGSNDAFEQILSLSLVLCYLCGIVGRNFGSDKLVVVQVLIGSTLILTGLAGYGGIYGFVLALFLVPFFVAIRLMSGRLREMLHSAEIMGEANQIIAERFDTALENITHGIAMFSQEGEIIVANERFKELVNMDGCSIVGQQISVLDTASILIENGEPLFFRLKRHLVSRRCTKFSYQLDDNRIIEADYNAMLHGGVIVLSDISERVASEKAIRHLANFDVLTQLPNRRYFVAEIERRLQKQRVLKPCSMYFLDLDKFKEVNDTLGHAVGDKLLTTIADRFSSSLKKTDLMCRFGGDEFVIVVPDVVDKEQCSAIAKKLIDQLNNPVTVDHHSISIGVSVGIAIAPRDGKTAEDLLQNTDAALYESKSKGRGTYTFYSSALGDELRLRRELEIDLKKAIEEETLSLHFQPLVNLKHGRITTCEALARWNHPVHGAISPERFVRIAEESGFIGELGYYVLRRSMLECLKWPAHVRVAVNVSAIQFHRSDVFGTISALLDETGLAADRLEVEITESVMISSFDETIIVLRQLEKLGVRISLDDFGTGFSSLSYLHQLPLNKVKIDRSFIKNGVNDQRSFTLLKGVVDLTKALGLKTVLEGIETDAQLNSIANTMEVDEVQGFLFSRPLPAKDIFRLLSYFSVEKPPVKARRAASAYQ